MLTSLFRSTVCALALSFASTACAAEPLKDLLGRIARAYGGTPPAAMIERGTTTSFRRGEGALLRRYNAPDHFRIQIDYPVGAEDRTMIGPNAWQQGTPANPILRGAIALQVARIALPWNLLAKRDAVVDLGMVSSPEGKTLRALEFPLEEGLKIIVEADPDNGRILRSRGIQTMGPNTMEFATIYTEFRSAGGRIHASREEHYAMGQHTGYSDIDRVEYPDAIPDSAFAP